MFLSLLACSTVSRSFQRPENWDPIFFTDGEDARRIFGCSRGFCRAGGRYFAALGAAVEPSAGLAKMASSKATLF